MDNETRKQAALRRTASILNTIVPQNNSTSQQNGELTKTSKEEEFKSVKFLVDEEKRIGTIVLARPSRLNAIDRFMPSEIRRAVELAERDNRVHVIVVCGEGDSFCSGYDLIDFAQNPGSNYGVQEMPWDPTLDYKMMSQNTSDFMSLFRCSKPTIAKIRGSCVAGGSDIALCCDLLIMTKNARIGYPPARVWGCPTTAMWVYRLGPTLAKRMLFTGDLINGETAQKWGLALSAVSDDQLDQEVEKLAKRISSVPKSQLFMQKKMINQALDNMGLASTQQIATLFDGVSRHSPEGMWFKQRAEEAGFKTAVKERDSGEPIAVEAERKINFP